MASHDISLKHTNDALRVHRYCKSQDLWSGRSSILQGWHDFGATMADRWPYLKFLSGNYWKEYIDTYCKEAIEV
jgi:hypothetical protein